MKFCEIVNNAVCKYHCKKRLKIVSIYTELTSRPEIRSDLCDLCDCLNSEHCKITYFHTKDKTV